MGVSIELWRARIGLYSCRSGSHSKCPARGECESILFLILAATVLFVLLLVGNIELHPGPFPCKLCSVVPETISSSIRHQHYHSGNADFMFFCPSPTCLYFTKSFNSLNVHVSRNHRGETHKDLHPGPVHHQDPVDASILCQKCQYSTTSLWEYVQHLSGHLDDGISVECPIEGCTFQKPFVKKSTLRVHLSQYHRNWKEEGVPKRDRTHALSQSVAAGFQDGAGGYVYDGDSMDFENDDCEDSSDGQNDLLNDQSVMDNIGKFYLHLYAVNLLPFETIQEISESLTFISDIMHARIKLVVSADLKRLHVPDDEIRQICHRILLADLWYTSHHKDQPGTSLTSDHLRKKYFRQNFGFIDPIAVNLDENDPDSKKQYQYVPVSQTLDTLLQDPSIQKEIDQSFHRHEQQKENSEEVCDYTDGSQFQSENHPPKEIHLFLYQDSFNPVMNALGSAANKFKQLVVYFTLANYKPHFRSKISTKHLVMGIRESLFKAVGASKCFERLKLELKKLETDGVLYKGQIVKVVLQYILGDNLGQHMIGGLIETFSGNFFCRFCDLSKLAFLKEPWKTNPLWSKEDYNRCARRALLREEPCKAIKTECDFNQLNYFHASSHLVPCLAHDLFEGVVSWDLSGIIQRFVKEKKWFSYRLLNRRIRRFRCLGADMPNKPSYVRKNGEKLGGHAIQNWTLLRLLPFIIGDKIQDHDDAGWKQYLKLKNLCEHFCAPSFRKSDVPFIKDVLLPEYFELRASTLDQNKYRLKPKHHFMAHYPELMLKYGPLIYLWTLGFEQKHKFFKELIRKTQNFINVEYTCAVRHQMNLCYLSSGQFFPEDCHELNSTPLSIASYPGELSQFLAGMNIADGTRDCEQISLDGLIYKKGSALLLPSEQQISVGIVRLIISKEDKMEFILEVFMCSFFEEMGIYQLPADVHGELRVVSAKSLKYPVPQPLYNYQAKLCFSLKNKLVAFSQL